MLWSGNDGNGWNEVEGGSWLCETDDVGGGNGTRPFFTWLIDISAFEISTKKI